MNKNTLQLVRNTIFSVTAAFAAVIITLPSGAVDATYGPAATSYDNAGYNPTLVERDTSGSKYRLNPAFKPQPDLQPRSLLSVSFDQKGLLPLKNGLNARLKKRHDIVFDRDRSLLVDFRLSNSN